eukprot:jgi/Mesvir1/4151/Mv26074-RA.1
MYDEGIISYGLRPGKTNEAYRNKKGFIPGQITDNRREFLPADASDIAKDSKADTVGAQKPPLLTKEDVSLLQKLFGYRDNGVMGRIFRYGLQPSKANEEYRNKKGLIPGQITDNRREFLPSQTEIDASIHKDHGDLLASTAAENAASLTTPPAAQPPTTTTAGARAQVEGFTTNDKDLGLMDLLGAVLKNKFEKETANKTALTQTQTPANTGPADTPTGAPAAPAPPAKTPANTGPANTSTGTPAAPAPPAKTPANTGPADTPTGAPAAPAPPAKTPANTGPANTSTGTPAAPAPPAKTPANTGPADTPTGTPAAPAPPAKTPAKTGPANTPTGTPAAPAPPAKTPANTGPANTPTGTPAAPLPSDPNSWDQSTEEDPDPKMEEVHKIERKMQNLLRRPDWGSDKFKKDHEDILSKFNEIMATIDSDQAGKLFAEVKSRYEVQYENRRLLHELLLDQARKSVAALDKKIDKNGLEWSGLMETAQAAVSQLPEGEQKEGLSLLLDTAANTQLQLLMTPSGSPVAQPASPASPVSQPAAPASPVSQPGPIKAPAKKVPESAKENPPNDTQAPGGRGPASLKGSSLVNVRTRVSKLYKDTKTFKGNTADSLLAHGLADGDLKLPEGYEVKDKTNAQTAVDNFLFSLGEIKILQVITDSKNRLIGVYYKDKQKKGGGRIRLGTISTSGSHTNQR